MAKVQVPLPLPNSSPVSPSWRGFFIGGGAVSGVQAGCVVTGEPWRAEFNYVGVRVNLPNATGEYTTTRAYYGQPTSSPPQYPSQVTAKPRRSLDAEAEKELRDFSGYLESKLGHPWPQEQKKSLDLFGYVFVRILDGYVDWAQPYDAKNRRSLLGDPKRDPQLARAINVRMGRWRHSGARKNGSDQLTGPLTVSKRAPVPPLLAACAAIK